MLTVAVDQIAIIILQTTPLINNKVWIVNEPSPGTLFVKTAAMLQVFLFEHWYCTSIHLGPSFKRSVLAHCQYQEW